jgi:hypothetical protein
MRFGYILLIPLVIVLLLADAPEASAEMDLPWRSTRELPGYPYWSEDPWAWKNSASRIGTAAYMDFGEHRRGMRPLVNFYVEKGGCNDPEALKVYRRYIEDAVAYLAAHRDWFVENYPQFSYLKKLRFQISNSTAEKALNIPVKITEGCVADRPSVARMLVRVWLRHPDAAFHEFVHAIGAHEICIIAWEGGLPTECEKMYYYFYTLWGWTGDIGENTLMWYALALSWSWLYFYEEHPGPAGADYASRLPSKPKYSHLYTRKFYTEIFGTEVEIYGYVVTLKDMLESGVIPRPARGVAELRLKGGAVIPTLSLWPEEWMRGHPILDYVDNDAPTINDRLAWNLVSQSQIGIALPRGFAVGYESFSRRNPLLHDYLTDEISRVWRDVLRLIDDEKTLTIREQPWTDAENLRYLIFTDLRPDLYYCGYVYKWYGQQDEKVLFLRLYGNESFRPSLRQEERITYHIVCYYSWGPYVYRAPRFYFEEDLLPIKRDTSGREYYAGTYVIVGVPASERIVQDSPGIRRVFSGIWLVNGTEWPGPYLDLDILGWKVQGKPPERRPYVTGKLPGASVLPGWGPSVRLYDPNGPMRLDNFTQRYRSFERVPWMVGVTFLKLRHNTTAEPLYYREHFINVTIPEGFRVLDGNVTGWYREGTKIRLPRLSELEVSKGTKLVHEGWKDNSGRIYRPGEELVVDGPKSFEPVLVKYHLVSVKGPKELKHEGSGWHREGSSARLRVAENVTYVSDVTRYVFLGFRRGNETVNEVEVRVDGPVEVEAVWRREHLLTVRSRFLNWTFTDPWFEENTTYMFIIPGDFHNLRNGTMVQIKGIETVSGGKRFAAERIEGESIDVNMTVGGRRVRILWNVTFTVHGPIEMRIYWTVRYALDVSSPAGVVSIRNSSLPLPATVFVEEGEKITLDFKSVQLTGDTNRLVLHDVIMDNRSLGPITSLDIEVKRPVSIFAVYRDQVLVWPKLRGQDGSVADPDLVVLRSDLGELVSEEGKAVWLDRYLTLGLRSVEWKVVKAVYKGVDVTVNAIVRAGEPGTIAISASISGLMVKVRDVLGMPVPFANVVYSGPGGDVKASTDYSGTAKLGVVPNGQGRLSAGLIGASEGEVLIPPGEHTIVLPVSQYTIALFASLITPTYVVVRRGKKRS